jgi:hypothetical protein
MSRRWAPPVAPTPQQQLVLPQRGRFVPAVRIAATETSRAAAESMGIARSGDVLNPTIADLAKSMVNVLERHSRKVKLSGVMMALQVRGEVLAHLKDHAEGLTADEVAYALGYSILTVRPRVSELKRMKLIVDAGLRRPNASGRNAIAWRVA